jgi:hypothetical protein
MTEDATLQQPCPEIAGATGIRRADKNGFVWQKKFGAVSGLEVVVAILIAGEREEAANGLWFTNWAMDRVMSF